MAKKPLAMTTAYVSSSIDKVDRGGRVDFETPEWHKQYNAPTARMMDSQQTASMAARANKAKGKGRPRQFPAPAGNGSKTKTTQDYQADADRREEARDRGDPDFELVDTPPSPPPSPKNLKRKTTSADAETSGGSRKKRLSKNKRYVKCGEPTQTERDYHIKLIKEAWGGSYKEWMSQALMPYSKEKRPGGMEFNKTLEPRDWNTPLLKKLAELSHLTPGERRTDASQALWEAIERDGRQREDRVLLPDDVEHAIALCERKQAAMPSSTETLRGDPQSQGGRSTPSYMQERSQVYTDIDVQHPNEASAPEASTDLSNQCPSPRSPTIGREDPPIKKESEAAGWMKYGKSNYDEQYIRCQEAAHRRKVAAARLEFEEAEKQYFDEQQLLRKMYGQHGNNKEDAIVVPGDNSPTH